MRIIPAWLHRSIRIRRLRAHHKWLHKSRVLFIAPAYDPRDISGEFMRNCVYPYGPRR